ncbi:septal ring lytic transglycosylase RlpA family protein [Parvibium lacunae]|uniref:Endolytic peptidoglycan transglycosylase RlpA n=1 Tax=Parvibium lacunae TaxID=1888893 RepID=A0A368L1V4_9BURK|nr:septal ring lytic transglycosylase RlpA family protein [Parvibium lacunae]RCS57092.1 septal ring lytic transglycosylase RlpA family protein [Parvibium lacunae]
MTHHNAAQQPTCCQARSIPVLTLAQRWLSCALCCASLSIIGGCASGPTTPSPTPPTSTSAPSRTENTPASRTTTSKDPANAEAGRTSPPARRGAFYQDDGPGDNPPADLDSIPDATPRIEPLLRGPNRPYVVFGTEYVPDLSDRPYKQRGIASWYGRKFHGQKTSSGELYDMYGMSAAHPTLPIPSYARITSLVNGKQVIVRINDRGPFLHNRIIDLSYTAAHKLGIAQRGSGPVEVEHLRTEDIKQLLANRGNAPAATSAAKAPNPVAPIVQNTTTPPPALPTVRQGSGLFIQLAAFSSAEAADNFRAHLYRLLDWLNEPIEIVPNAAGLHRLHLGPYPDRAAAQAVAEKIREALNLKPVVVERPV